MDNKKEIRFDSELRTGTALGGNSGGEELALVGRAVRYNTLSAPIPAEGSRKSFRERVMPGAFKRSLADKSTAVLADYNHQDNSLPLGSTESGTLKLQEKEDGLYFRIQLSPQIQAHRELHASVARGDVQKCSWAFQPYPEDGSEDWDVAKDADGQLFNRRTLKAVKLFGVSVVNRPAYPGDATTVSARAVDAAENAQLRARAKELGDKIAAESRAEQGQAGDPTQLLRCPGRSLTSNRADHIAAASQHRCIATRCKTAARADMHFRAADAHKLAATVSPNDESLFAETAGKAVVACQRAHDYQNMREA